MTDRNVKEMRVTTVVQIDVDVAAWNREYGADETPAQIREQIKARVNEAAAAHFSRFDYARVNEANVS